MTSDSFAAGFRDLLSSKCDANPAARVAPVFGDEPSSSVDAKLNHR
jgi:hypothetical protein